VRPNAVQVADESDELGFVQWTEQEVIQGVYRRIQRLDQSEAHLRDRAPYVPPIVGTSPASDPALSFHSIDKARDPGRALTDRQCREPLFASTAEDSQHVVLRERDVGWFYDCRGPSLEIVSGV
jgi:hypothetical protein